MAPAALQTIAVIALSLPLGGARAPAGEAVENAAKPPAGAWKQSDTDQVNFIRFEPLRLVQYRGGQLRFIPVVYEGGRLIQLGLGGARTPLGKYEVKGDVLSVEGADGKRRMYQRLTQEPPELTLTPVPLGAPRPLKPKMLQQVREDLARRESATQKLRLEFRAALKDDAKRAAKIKEMAAADAADSRYLRGLLRDVGWIDSRRFGGPAQDAAFLILMHTADPALKEAALPALLQEVKAGRFDAELYAGLYDRYCGQVGLPDRYGMHVSPDPKGRLVVGPLEDRVRVDDFRKEIGLPPLARYLERYRAENGGKAVRIVEP